jgi:hypothetical protein
MAEVADDHRQLGPSSRRDAGVVRQCERKPPPSSNQPIPKHVSPVEFPHSNSHCRAPSARIFVDPGERIWKHHMRVVIIC